MKIPQLSHEKFILATAIWWIFWTLLQTYLLIDAGFGWEISLADSFAYYTCLAAASYAIGMQVKYFTPESKNRYLLFLSGLGLAVLCVFTEGQMLKYFFKNQTGYYTFYEKTALLRFSFALLMIEFRMVVSWIWYYLLSVQEKEKRQSQLEDMAKEAELSRLRLQLQPHFLFNSLNSISALAGSKPEEARKMIQQLSDFLRGTMRKEDSPMATLQEELQHLNLYLEIEKVRFGHRLTTEIHCDTDALKKNIPTLLLQPVVENAIKFGLYDTVGSITITIKAVFENHYLEITVQNPFDIETSDSNKGTGFGLSSVQRRLYLLFGRNDLLSVAKDDNQFITKIRIPQSE